MFSYWRGYEIDGSSTTYNIVVPQRELISEVMRYFLGLKIIDHNANLSVSYSESTDKSWDPKRADYRKTCYNADEIDKVCEILERPSTQTFFLATGCIHPDKLFHQVRRELYQLSQTRPGAENIDYQYRNPTVSPFYFGPDLGLTFEVSFKSREAAVENYDPQGLVFNKQAIISNMKGQHFTVDLGCGPGFIYEYAAYIISKMAERFPEIGIDGGIDCAGGFVDGCTYASSLYKYERLTLASADISGVTKLLLQEGIIVPHKRTGKYGRDIVPCVDLALYNLYNFNHAKEEHLDGKGKIVKGILAGRESFTADEYEHFVRKISEIPLIDRIYFMHYCTCYVKINDDVGALTCVKEDDRVFLELRVPFKIREELAKKLGAYRLFVR